jgi:hypothetical protein
MVYSRIKILKEAGFKPKSKPHHHCISPKLKKYLSWLNEIKHKIDYSKYPTSDKYSELRSIALFFDLKLIVRHELKTAGGIYHCETKTIEISEHRYGRKKSLKWLKAVFTHELAHALQDNIGSLDHYWDSLADALKLEQEAETVSKKLCEILFPDDVFGEKYFNAYFKEKDIIFLLKYQKDLNNNLFQWLSRK